MLLVQRILRKIDLYFQRKKFHNVYPSFALPDNLVVSNPDQLIMEEGSELSRNTLILNINSKVHFGKYSGAGPGLTIIAGNHMSVVGKFLNQVTDEDKKKLDPNKTQDKDVVLEEDVWLGTNVTLLNGVRIGRGAVIAAGTVVRTKIPPYAIVGGNPAKVLGFRFSPDEIEEHESILYPESERLSRKVLDKNYKKYYMDRLQEITNLCRI